VIIKKCHELGKVVKFYALTCPVLARSNYTNSNLLFCIAFFSGQLVTQHCQVDSEIYIYACKLKPCVYIMFVLLYRYPL